VLAYFFGAENFFRAHNMNKVLKTVFGKPTLLGKKN
jgi:hypothetical protein